MKKIKVGLIGCGLIARYAHMQAYAQLGEKIKVVAVADVVEDMAKEVSNRFNVERWYTDYRDILSLEEIDAVHICLPHFVHKEAVTASAEAGKHILLEKPISRTIEEADCLINATKKAGVKLMVGFNRRFIPQYQKMKEYITKNYLGDLFLVSITQNDYWAPEGWRLSKESTGGGVLIDAGMHAVDEIRWFAGDVATVFAQMGTFVHECEAEDNAALLLKFKNGAIGQITASWSAKGFNAPFANEYVSVYGKRGTARADMGSNNLTIHSDRLPQDFQGSVDFTFSQYLHEDKTMGPTNSFTRQLSHFADCIIEDKEPVIRGEDGKAALEIVLAAYKSAETGREIHLSTKSS